MDTTNITIVYEKVNEVSRLITEKVLEIVKEFEELFLCFKEKKEEEIEIFSSEQYKIFTKNNYQSFKRSFYTPPFVHVPRHLAYQIRHYQRLFCPLLYL